MGPSGPTHFQDALWRDRLAPWLNVLIHPEEILRIISLLELNEASIAVAVGQPDPVSLLLRHEVHVDAASGVGSRGIEKIPAPGNAGLVLTRLSPPPVDIHDELGITVPIGSGVGRDPAGRTPHLGEEDLALGARKPLDKGEGGVQKAVAQLQEVM